jgi:hypothetical protein
MIRAGVAIAGLVALVATTAEAQPDAPGACRQPLESNPNGAVLASTVPGEPAGAPPGDWLLGAEQAARLGVPAGVWHASVLDVDEDDEGQTAYFHLFRSTRPGSQRALIGAALFEDQTDGTCIRGVSPALLAMDAVRVPIWKDNPFLADDLGPVTQLSWLDRDGEGQLTRVALVQSDAGQPELTLDLVGLRPAGAADGPWHLELDRECGDPLTLIARRVDGADDPQTPGRPPRELSRYTRNAGGYDQTGRWLRPTSLRAASTPGASGAFTILPFDLAALPEAARVSGAVAGARWSDAAGEHLLVLSVEDPTPQGGPQGAAEGADDDDRALLRTSALRARRLDVQDGMASVTWSREDVASCGSPHDLEFHAGLNPTGIHLSDVDGDGNAELSWDWRTACTPSLMDGYDHRIIVQAGGEGWAVTGSDGGFDAGCYPTAAPLDEAGLKDAPAPMAELARTLWHLYAYPSNPSESL